VKSNKDSAGIKGMTVEQLPAYLKKIGLQSATSCSVELISRVRCGGVAAEEM